MLPWPASGFMICSIGRTDRPVPAVNASPAMATLVAKVTSREWDVATLMAKGLSNKQVAQHLNLEEGTVKIHLHDIFTKLAVKKPNRTCCDDS